MVYNKFMRKLLFLLVLLLTFSSNAAEKLQNVGIEKYAVLEVINDNTPLRTEDNENAYRLTHLFKDAILFADKQNENYYRVELNDNEYVWVNKKLVEVQAVIPEKRFENIDKISFKETKNAYTAQIDTSLRSAFLFKESGNNLEFNLYDNRFDPIETKIVNNNTAFKLPNTIENGLKLNYISDKPIFGYYLDKAEKGYNLTIKKAPKINQNKPLKNIRIVVDPGHGGDEFGAKGFGYEEKTINLQI